MLLKFIKVLLYSLLLVSTSFDAQVEIEQNKRSYIRTNYLSDNPKQDSLDVVVDSVLKKYMQDLETCGISIGISMNGKNYFYNYGEVKRDYRTLPDKTSIYEIGALSTSFIGLLLAQAMVEKRINPEADIRKYLPGKYPALEFGKTAILVKHLANHTSGLICTPEDLKSVSAYDSLNPYAGYTKEMILSALKNTQLKTEPGSESDYSNLGMAVLGIILENVYKKSFEEMVVEKICSPLELKNTRFHLNEEQNKKLSTGYNQNGIYTPAWTLSGFDAAGGLKSDTEDLLKYLNYLLIKTDKPAELVIQPTYYGKPKLATTWYLTQTQKKNTLIWQSGGTYGFGAFMGFIPAKNCAVVILSNTNRSLDFLAIALFNYLQQ